MNTWINQETTLWLFEPIKEGIVTALPSKEGSF